MRLGVWDNAVKESKRCCDEIRERSIELDILEEDKLSAFHLSFSLTLSISISHASIRFRSLDVTSNIECRAGVPGVVSSITRRRPETCYTCSDLSLALLPFVPCFSQPYPSTHAARLSSSVVETSFDGIIHNLL